MVSERDITIGHDGGQGGSGSLVVCKGRTRISFANNTLIYAVEGADVSSARNVHAFNTPDRETSWGHINNIAIEPLFRKRFAPDHSPPPAGSTVR